MEINVSKQPAITPAGFGAPGSGHAAGTTLGFAITSVVRDREAIVTGDMGLALTYVPGTSAWSPPLS